MGVAVWMFAGLCGAGVLTLVSGLDNGLALTPPMGWLSWERFMCNTDCDTFPDTCISERLFTAMADELVAGGYRDAGYTYVNVDDCWQNRSRDSEGRLQPDAERFPHGIKWLADYMHERGLKLGIYTDYGTSTCEGYPGTPLDKQQIDAETFAAWGVDSVKVDGCNSNTSTMNEAYPRFSDLLNATGRPMLYSCSWPDYLNDHVNFSFVAQKCNLWRMYRDIYAQWPIIQDIVEFYGKNAGVLQPVAGSGHWNDADQLTVGDHHPQGWCHNSSDPDGGCNGLTQAESESVMGLWAVLASPLLMSNDLRTVAPWAKAILLNADVIAVSQDPLGVQGVRIVDNTTMGNTTVTTCAGVTPESCSARVVAVYPVGGTEVWARPLSNGDLAVLVLNKNTYGAPMDISVPLTDIGAFNASITGHVTGVPLLNATFRELFNHTPPGVAQFSLTATDVPPHGSRLFRVTAAPTRWIPNRGTAAGSWVLNSSGYNPGNPPWMLVDGVLRFECGVAGWDAALPKGAAPPYWVTFDLGEVTPVDGFALSSDGSGAWDVAEFDLEASTSPTGPWGGIANASGIKAQTGDGGVQVFGGFAASSRYFRWVVTKTGGWQPWVKEVQFRRGPHPHRIK
eukprot:m.244505 g.244505  ORF g.244505 m.244505 type:complete len:622 (-) comp15844_c0_seq5:40-1905(-)